MYDIEKNLIDDFISLSVSINVWFDDANCEHFLKIHWKTQRQSTLYYFSAIKTALIAASERANV